MPITKISHDKFKAIVQEFCERTGSTEDLFCDAVSELQETECPLFTNNRIKK